MSASSSSPAVRSAEEWLLQRRTSSPEVIVQNLVTENQELRSKVLALEEASNHLQRLLGEVVDQMPPQPEMEPPLQQKVTRGDQATAIYAKHRLQHSGYVTKRAVFFESLENRIRSVGYTDIDIAQFSTCSILQDVHTPICRVEDIVTHHLTKLMSYCFGVDGAAPQLITPTAVPTKYVQKVLADLIENNEAPPDLHSECLDAAWKHVQAHDARVMKFWSTRFQCPMPPQPEMENTNERPKLSCKVQ